MQTEILTSESLIALLTDVQGWLIDHEHTYTVLSIATNNLPHQYIATITYV